MYVVAADSRYGDIVIFLVDNSFGSIMSLRRKRRWWTARLSQARVFSKKADASKVVSTLRFNNPRVLTLEEARKAKPTNHEDQLPESNLPEWHGWKDRRRFLL